MHLKLWIRKFCYFVCCWLNYFMPASKRRDPAIRRHEVLTLDPEKFNNQLLTGAVELEFAGERFQLQLQLQPNIEHNEPLQGEQLVESKLKIYVGNVANQAGSKVIFMLVGDQLLGFINNNKHRWFIEPADWHQVKTEPNVYWLFRDIDVHMNGICPSPSVGGGGEHNSDDHEEEVEDLPSNRFELVVAMVSDPEMQAAYRTVGNASVTSQVTQVQTMLIALVNEMYASHFYSTPLMQFSPRYFFTRDESAGLNSSDSSELLDQLESEWSATHGNMRLAERRQQLGIDLVHLTTGKTLEGLTIGRAQQPGVFSLSRQNYASGPNFRGGGGFFGSSNSNLGFTPTLYRRAIILAHELGHNLSAVHEQGIEYCTEHFIVICIGGERTIMYPTLNNDTIGRYSTGNREPTSANNFGRIFPTARNWHSRDL